MYSQAAADENYLRGVQATDESGTATFTSIFPACYAGRWPHVHFEVYEKVGDATSSGPIVKTSQIALPKAACETVYATSGYEQSVATSRRSAWSATTSSVTTAASTSSRRCRAARRRLHRRPDDRRLTAATWQSAGMSEDEEIVVSALAINVTIPEAMRWTDTRRGQTFRLDTLNVRMLPNGHLAAKAYGRPVEGGRGAYVSFTVPDRPELAPSSARPPTAPVTMWSAHHGLRDQGWPGRPEPAGQAAPRASGRGSACTMVSSDTARVSTT